MSINIKGSRIQRNWEPSWVMELWGWARSSNVLFITLCISLHYSSLCFRESTMCRGQVCLWNQGKVTSDFLLSVVEWKGFWTEDQKTCIITWFYNQLETWRWKSTLNSLQLTFLLCKNQASTWWPLIVMQLQSLGSFTRWSWHFLEHGLSSVKKCEQVPPFRNVLPGQIHCTLFRNIYICTCTPLLRY